MRISRQYAEERFNAVASAEPAGLGATRANLSRLLRSLDFVGWSTHEESGRLDRKALTRYASGSTAIFSRREYKEAEKSAVSVLIDCSGSMDNERIVIAEQVAIHLSRIFSRSRVPFAVTGFHIDRSSYEVLDGEEVRTSTPTFIQFKRWDEPLARCHAKLGSIRKAACGGTPDYASIYSTIDEIGRRDEQRKIVFLLTDADGYNVNHMKHLQKFADSLNVTIIAIGIGRTDVTRCFVNSQDVHNINQLTSTAFNQLLRVVDRKSK